MKNIFCILTIIMVSISPCRGQVIKEEEQQKAELDLTTTYPKMQNPGIRKTWKNVKSIQKEWIKVEKDKDGYLIYDPCEGSTQTVKFENSKITVHWRTEKESKYSYKNFMLTDFYNVFRLDAFDNENNFEIKAKIIDHKNGIVLWTFNDQKWLMTPIENYYSFRIIKNNCKTGEKSELHFLPVTE